MEIFLSLLLVLGVIHLVQAQSQRGILLLLHLLRSTCLYLLPVPSFNNQICLQGLLVWTADYLRMNRLLTVSRITLDCISLRTQSSSKQEKLVECKQI